MTDQPSFSATTELSHPESRMMQQIHDSGDAGVRYPGADHRLRRKRAADLVGYGLVTVDADGTYRASEVGKRWIDLNGPIDLLEPIPFGQTQLPGDVAAAVEELRQALEQETKQPFTFDAVAEALMRKQVAIVNAQRIGVAPALAASNPSAPVRFTRTPSGDPDLIVWADVAAHIAPNGNPGTIALRAGIRLLPLPAGLVEARGGRGRPPIHGVRTATLDLLEPRHPFEVSEIRRKIAEALAAPIVPEDEDASDPDKAVTLPDNDFPESAGVYEIRCNAPHAPGYFISTSSNVKQAVINARSRLKHGAHNCRALQTAWSLQSADAFSFVFVRDVDGGKFGANSQRESVIRQAMQSGRPGLYNPIV